MKRVITLFLALLLAALPALAEAAALTPYDHHVMYTADGEHVVYDFPDIMLFLPIEWKEAITVEQTDGGAAFYQTANLDRHREAGVSGGGLLFRLCASADEGFRGLPAYEYLGRSESAGLHFT